MQQGQPIHGDRDPFRRHERLIVWREASDEQVLDEELSGHEIHPDATDADLAIELV